MILCSCLGISLKVRAIKDHSMSNIPEINWGGLTKWKNIRSCNIILLFCSCLLSPRIPRSCRFLAFLVNDIVTRVPLIPGSFLDKMPSFIMFLT